MHISKRKITASSNPKRIAVPAPFDRYYRLASDEEIAEYTDSPSRPYPSEHAGGYDIKHLSYVFPKPEYLDALSDEDLDILELVVSGWDEEIQLAYASGRRIYDIDISEVEDAIRAAGIEACDSITSAVDTGMEYWYFTRHGLGPGMMPKGVNIVDTYEEGYKTWFKTDKLLTTSELNEYDIKEEWPPEGVTTHNGEVIEACNSIKGATDPHEYAFYKGGVNQGKRFDGELERFQNRYYDGEYLDSYDSETPLDGMCWSIGYSDDYDGTYWRSFSPDNWSKVEDMSDEEIYNKFPAAIEARSKVAASNDKMPSAKQVSEDDTSITYVVSTDDVDDDPDWATDCTNPFKKSSKQIIGGYDYDDDEDDDPDWEDDEEFDDIVSFDSSSSVVCPAIEDALGVSSDIANIIYNWYDAEDAWEDFDSVADFISYMKHDIYDMADACDDDDERDRVLEAIEGCTQINSASDVSADQEEEDFLDQPEQEYSSADTAINGKQGKLPAVFSKITVPSGALVLDYGGGTPESEQVAQNYLDQFDAKEMLYDPYNQTADHNRWVIKELKSNGGADLAVCSNVLNVIKEQEVRLDLLKKIQKLLKPGATAYISVYEGSGSGEGSATQGGRSYQNKRKLVTYLDEVKEIFPEAIKKGAVIVAPNTAASKVGASISLQNIDIPALETELKEGIREYFGGPYGGWPEEELDQAVADYSKVSVRDEGDHFVIDVRAELSYEGMERLSMLLDKIVQNYDEDAYFDMISPGIMEAYIWERDEDISGSTDVTASEDTDDIVEDAKFELNFDLKIDVRPDGSWSITEGDPIAPIDVPAGGISKEALTQDFMDVLNWYIPAAEGKYGIEGEATLIYTVDEIGQFTFDAGSSWATDIKTTTLGEVKSSTQVVASMTEAELDDALLNGKPFELEDFKKYKSFESSDMIKAKDVEVGDTIDIEGDASEVNLGTIVKVLSINDPKESWIDFTFECEVLEDPGKQSISPGDIIQLHFDEDESLGYIIPV